MGDKVVKEINELIKDYSQGQKICLLYRARMIDLNKRLSGIFYQVNKNQIGLLRDDFFHSFFDANNKSSMKYIKANEYLDNDDIADYLSPMGMVAYALFIESFINRFNETKKYETSKNEITSLFRRKLGTFIRYDEIQLLEKPTGIKTVYKNKNKLRKVSGISIQDRQYMIEKIKNEISTYNDFDKINNVEQYLINNLYIDCRDEEYAPICNDENEIAEENERIYQKRLEEERRNDAAYSFEETEVYVNDK